MAYVSISMTKSAYQALVNNRKIVTNWNINGIITSNRIIQRNFGGRYGGTPIMKNSNRKSIWRLYGRRHRQSSSNQRISKIFSSIHWITRSFRHVRKWLYVYLTENDIFPKWNGKSGKIARHRAMKRHIKQPVRGASIERASVCFAQWHIDGPVIRRRLIGVTIETRP